MANQNPTAASMLLSFRDPEAALLAPWVFGLDAAGTAGAILICAGYPSSHTEAPRVFGAIDRWACAITEKRFAWMVTPNQIHQAWVAVMRGVVGADRSVRDRYYESLRRYASVIADKIGAEDRWPGDEGFGDGGGS